MPISPVHTCSAMVNGADGEDQQRAERRQREQVAVEDAEHRAGDQRATDAGDDGVDGQAAQPDDAARPGQRPGARAHADDRGDQVAADDPADGEVEGGQAAGVAVGGGEHVVGGERALLRGVDLAEHLGQRGADRAALGAGDQQGVRRAGAQHQDAVDLPVGEQPAGVVLAAGDPHLERVAGAAPRAGRRPTRAVPAGAPAGATTASGTSRGVGAWNAPT